MQLIMTIGEATVASRYKLLSAAVTVVTASGCPGKPRFIVLCFTELHRRHFFFFKQIEGKAFHQQKDYD